MGLRNTMNMRDEVDIKIRHYIDGIKIRTKGNLNDNAVDAEGFFRNLLNVIYKFNLTKDTIESAHQDTIDLHSLDKKICVQVTAQNNAQKVTRTVNHFKKNEYYKKYNELHFLILDRERCFKYDKYKLRQLGINIEFHDYSTIYQKLVNDFDNADKMFEVYDFVMKELDEDYLEKSKNKNTNKKSQKYIKEKLEGLHIVDQIYSVLKQFEGFRMIYPRTLSRLYPFNIELTNYDSYSNYCLKTNNIEIHQLLQKVKISNGKELEIADKSLEKYSEKLLEIFTWLNQSFINCICYREKYTEIEHHSVLITKYKSECTCMSCNYLKFNTQPLFILLKEKSLKPSDKLSEALREGYYLCKLGEHIRGWQIFDYVAKKSMEEQKYLTHFITLHNILSIHNFICSPWLESEAKAISPKIKEIDLHNTICEIDVPIEVRDELIKVKEDYHLNYSREKIEDYSEKIRKTRDLYRRNGFSSGPNNAILLNQELRLLFTFYTSNNIISDDFFTFQATIKKGIEALFMSYSTDERFEYKYKVFDNFILSMMFFYVEEDSIESIFIGHNIKKIKIDVPEKRKLVKLLSNFFSSQFTTSKWTEPSFYGEIKKQEYFSHYRQLLRHLLNRIMLIVSKVDLKNEEIKPITQPFINFLSTNEDLNHSSWKFISRFLETHIGAFDQKQIQKIIEIAFTGKNHSNNYNLLEKICNNAAYKTNFIISDDGFFFKLVNQFSNPCSGCNCIHEMKQILAFWNVANNNGKCLLKKKSIEYLNTSFDPDFYQNGIFLNIFNKKNHPYLLEKYIKYTQNNCHKFDLNEENGKWIFQSYTGYNCINGLAYLKVDFSLEEFKVIAQKSEYYNWLINYDNYDYSNFNLRWLTDACPFYLRTEVSRAKPLKEMIHKELSQNFDEELAEFYFKFFPEY